MAPDKSALIGSSAAEDRLSAQLAALCRQLLGIARNKLSGTLTIVSAEGAEKSFLCRNGAVCDVDTGRERTLLAEALLDSGAISPRMLRKAEKSAEKSSTPLGGALLELNAVPEETVLEAIQARVADEFTEVFAWEIEQIRFTPHSPRESLEGFRSELSQYFDLEADPEELIVETAQRLERWDLIQANFEILRDVFYATPSTFRYFRDPETYPDELRVLGAIDGMKDVEEVVAESGLDSFDAIKVVRRLVRQGEIELINPVQMFQLGTESAANGSLEKACKLFRRAKERGLDDFDLEFRLAETLDRLGRRKEAAHWYLSFSTSCLSQLRVDEAINCLRRVVRIAPEQEVALDKLLEIYLQQKRCDEALDVALRITKLREAKECHSAALRLLISLKPHLDGKPKFHEKIAELAEHCRQPEIARQERELLAQAFDERKDAQQALEAYQSMFCAGDNSLEVRLKLISLHRQQGNRQKAIDHINALLCATGKRRVKNPQTLLFLHTAMVDLRPGDARSSRWLIDHYLKNDEKGRAVEVLQRWRGELEREEDHEGLVDVLQKLLEIDGDLEHRWALAKALERLGRVEDSRRELRSLAHMATGEKKFDQAARALDLILKQSPLDVETRKVQVDLLETRGEEREAIDKLKDVAVLEMIAGRVKEAEEYCRRVLIADPNAADIVLRLGLLCLEKGDHRKAVEQFLKAAKIHLESRNFGLARQTLARLHALDAGHQEIAKLQAKLDERLSALEPAAREAPSASPPPAAARAPVSVPSSRTERTELTDRADRVEPALAGPAREPFQEPPAVRTTISGITARLRNLKSGPALPAAPGAPATAVPPAPVTSAPAPISTESTAATTTATALRAAAARLKSLAARGGPGSAAAAPPAAAAPAAAMPAPAAAETPAAPRGAETEVAGSAPASAPPSAQVREKLGAAASRLAKLRQKPAP